MRVGFFVCVHARSVILAALYSGNAYLWMKGKKWSGKERARKNGKIVQGAFALSLLREQVPLPSRSFSLFAYSCAARGLLFANCIDVRALSCTSI